MRVRAAAALVLPIVLASLAVAVVSNAQLYYGTAVGCNAVLIVGSSGGSGILGVVSSSGQRWVTVRGVAELYSVAIDPSSCVALAVGMSSSEGPAYVEYNISSGGLRTITLGGSGMLYGVAYGGGSFMAVGFANGSALALLINPSTLSYTSISLPGSYKALYGAAYGEGGFLLVGAGSSGAILGFYNASSGVFVDLSSRLPSTYNYALYSASYGALGFMIVGMGMVNESGFIEEYPLVGLVNATGGFRDLSMEFSQSYSLIMGVAYMDYEYLLVGLTTGGMGGYGYYSIYGATPIQGTVQSNTPYLPMILYSTAPISPGLFEVVGNNGYSSVAQEASIPPLYNVTLLSNARARISISGPVSANLFANSTIPLFPGSYRVLAMAKGYYNGTVNLYVTSNEEVFINMTKVRYCYLNITATVAGTTIPANVTIAMSSTWPNEEQYSFTVHGSAPLYVICNNYTLTIGGLYLINKTLRINLNESMSLKVNMTPIVYLAIKAPPISGRFTAVLRGVYNGSLVVNSSGVAIVELNSVGYVSIYGFRSINGIIQYMGVIDAFLMPGWNNITLTWTTPVISGLGIRTLVIGNRTVEVALNLSKVGNATVYVTYNGSVMLNKTYIESQLIMFNETFGVSGIYTLCAYTWSVFNGTSYMDYGPVCININVVIHSELMVFDESGIVSKLSGYYLGNETLRISIPRIVTFNNGTRLIYNGSIYNGVFIANNTYEVKLTKVVDVLEVLWIRQYLVDIEFVVDGHAVNSTSVWLTEGYTIRYPSILYFENGTRLVNVTNTIYEVYRPGVVRIAYITQYNVTLVEFSKLGIINETYMWVNTSATVRLSFSNITLANATRFMPLNKSITVTVHSPLIITVAYVVQYLVDLVRYSQLGVFNATYMWVNADSMLTVGNAVVYLGNSTRLYPTSNTTEVLVKGPLVVKIPYVVQYLVVNTTMVLNETWTRSSYWVNEGSLIAISPQGLIGLGNNTRLVLMAIYVNGMPFRYLEVNVSMPINVTIVYMRQWFIRLSLHSLNGTYLGQYSLWVNATQGYITSAPWANMTIPLTPPVAVNYTDALTIVNAYLDVAYRVFEIKDSLNLPAPYAAVTVSCGPYSTRVLSNGQGLATALVPLNTKCIVSGRPTVGYYGIALFAAVAVAASLSVIAAVRRR